jgi:hypothetical protein
MTGDLSPIGPAAPPAVTTPSAPAVYCTRCGTARPAQAQFCPNCGWQFSTGAPAPFAQPAAAGPPAPSGGPPPPPPPPGYLPPPAPYPQPPTPYPQPPAGYSPPVAHRGTNGFAVAGLVLGILWIYWIGSVLALIFGYVAKGQIDRSHGTEAGGGLAIAAIVLGWIGVGVGALVLVVLAISNS